MGVAGFSVALLITTLLMFRRDIKSLVKNQTVIEYKAEPVEKFTSLDLSSHWTANIMKGKECKVELSETECAGLNPELNIIDGTLFLSLENDSVNSGNIHIRITAPALNIIKAEGNTKIEMKSFWTDSLTVILKDSSTFTGSKNNIGKITFKALGEY